MCVGSLGVFVCQQRTTVVRNAHGPTQAMTNAHDGGFLLEPDMYNKPKERFWERVDRRGPDECWEWIGFRNKTGYGVYSTGPAGIRAHRWSWQIHHGEIPAGLCVCHKCDNRGCVNPNHLFLGTHAENMHDQFLKGRTIKGEKQNKAKLTEQQVREIRMRTEGATALAREYGVLRCAIYDIKRGVTWRHLAETPKEQRGAWERC